MNHVSIDAPVLRDVELSPVPRLNTPTASASLRGRVSLGVAAVRRLTAEQAAQGDEEWLDFLESESAHSDYLLLSLVCAFRPSDNDDPFVDAGLGIRLEAPDEPADRQPIAWSIAPKKRLAPGGGVGGRIALTAKLAIIESTLDVTPNQQQEQLFLVGMGERDSDPEWRFKATSSVPLIGDETLTVVVKAPTGATVRAHVSVAATVRQRRLGLIPYRAELPPALRTIDLQ
ncbi:hypothetical protein ACIOJE_00475 [Kitasatospora sp. NPDC087861]|uniref:hypothetical protein n=1 Tax=Kitasatospora sp. NPDC087861 TaxID=3364070 RepID=UPI0037FF4782